MTDTIIALEAAYETCKLIKYHCGNVIASSGFEESKSDQEWKRQAEVFIKWYDRRKLRGGSNWAEKLEKQMSKLLQEMDKF